MLRHCIKIAWRTFWKNKIPSSINIFGLALALTTCFFLYTYIRFHYSFDDFHSKSPHTYRLVNELHLQKTEYSKGASFGMYQAIREEIPEVENASFLLSDQDFTLKIGKNRFKTHQKAALTSSDWFDMFDFQWLQGNPEDLDKINTIALAAGTAKTYFGSSDVLGKTIYVDNKHLFEVVGIVDDSRENTNLKADIYLSINSIRTLFPDLREDFFTNWGFINSNNNVYLSLHDPAQKLQVEDKLMQLAAQNLDPSVVKAYDFKLIPLKDMHFDTRYGGTITKYLLLALGLIGFCILITACINHINLTLAQQAGRSAEIGTQKVLGGSTRQLFHQFLVESILVNFLAIGLSLTLTQAIFPLVNQHILVKSPIQIPPWYELSLVALSFWLLTTLMTGIYPAYMSTRVNAFDALNKNTILSKSSGRRSLLILQNTTALILLMSTIIIIAQVSFLKHTDMGFDRESVVVFPLSEKSNHLLTEKLENIPQVESYSYCFQSPAGRQRWGGTILFDQREDWEEWPARYVFGDSSYIHTFDIELLAGRNIRDHATTPEYLVNEKMIGQLGLNGPEEVLGKPLLAGGMNDKKAGTIVGVVNDFNTYSLLSPIEPVVIGYREEQLTSLAVKLRTGRIDPVLSDIRQHWQTLYPEEVFEFSFLDDRIQALYEKETLQQKLLLIAALIAIIISSLGLLGMISLTTLARTKEIAIRKVLGASVSSVVTLLSKDFIRMVLIATIIATPIAWYAMSRWLQGFAYRIELQWWMFAGAGLIAIVMAMFTVATQSVRAAMADPINSLKSE